MILHLKGYVGNKMVSKLIEAINDSEGNLCIYFTSMGGATDAAEAIIDIINKHSPKVSIVFYGDILSAGMEIFLRTNCEKSLLRDTRGMYHFSYQDITISEGGKPSTQSDIFYMKEMKKVKERTLLLLKDKGLTSVEIINIKRGMDVYFTNERMQQLIDGTK